MAAPRKYTQAQMLTALEQSKGMVTVAARLLGCAVDTMYAYLDRYPALAAAKAQQREGMTDVAELALYKAIQSGEAWAVCFYLKTQGKGRGYVERTEHTGPGGGAIEQRTEHSGVVEVRAVDYRQSIRALAPLALEEGDEGGDADAHEGAA
jgi:hypothetical protein